MINSRWVPLFLFAAAASLFTGCGGGSSSVSNAPPPPPSKLSIAFKPTPPESIFVNAMMSLTAVVQNDPGNSGVDWSLTCTSGNCGSLSALHTDSGKPTTYTPPTNLPQNSQTVNIVAFATSDHSKNVLAEITVSAFASSLKGTYVLQTRGVDSTGFPYHFAGVIVMDGNGKITSGEQTYTNYTMSTSDAITGGTYSIGPDGRGSIQFTTTNQKLGQAGVENFSLVVLSKSQALVARIDDVNLTEISSETAQGTLDLQTSTAAPAAGYAFTVSGTDVASLAPTEFGGVLNIDSPSAISGTGSVADEDLGGAVITNSTISGTVSAADSLGAIKLSLTPGFATVPIEFTGYIVDSSHIKLIECDNTSGTGFGSTSGVAVGQGSATGTFTASSAFSGNYVFGILGQDLSFLPASLNLAGIFTADGSGHLTNARLDEFYGGLAFQVRSNFGGSYTVDPSGTGRVDSFTHFPMNHPGPEFIFYLTGNGNPALMLDADINIGSLGAGGAYPSGAPPISFSGPYGLTYTQSVFGSENDASGQINVNPTALTLDGTVDTNFFFTPLFNTGMSGTFAPSSAPNLFPGTLSNELFPAALGMSYYMIDSRHGFFVETDFQSFFQLTFGYIAARTPVCDGCP